MCSIAQNQSNENSITEASRHTERAVKYFGVSWGIYPLLQVSEMFLFFVFFIFLLYFFWTCNLQCPGLIPFISEGLK